MCGSTQTHSQSRLNCCLHFNYLWALIVNIQMRQRWLSVGEFDDLKLTQAMGGDSVAHRYPCEHEASCFFYRKTLL